MKVGVLGKNSIPRDRKLTSKPPKSSVFGVFYPCFYLKIRPFPPIPLPALVTMPKGVRTPNNGYRERMIALRAATLVFYAQHKKPATACECLNRMGLECGLRTVQEIYRDFCNGVFPTDVKYGSPEHKLNSLQTAYNK